ncbi:TPA: hypothetical protein QIB60_004887, partial [Enterobacter cloacae subsp. dissolvens]|nr:hypothetical protein [Enterobacter cloacae subsp. dissolvens]
VLAPKGINALKTIRENNHNASGISSSARSSLHRAPSLSSTWREVYESMGVHFNSDGTFEFNEWHSFDNSEHPRPSVSSFGRRASTSSRASTTSSYERWWEETHTPTPLFPNRNPSEVSVSGYENIHKLPTTELNERILNHRNNMSRIFPERLTNTQYQHLARRLHPDSSGSADTEEAFKILNNWFNA